MNNFIPWLWQYLDYMIGYVCHIHRTVHLKMVNFSGCKFYLNELENKINCVIHVKLIALMWVSEWKSLSRVWLFATQWTVACQAPLSMGFSRQEYWSGLPFPSPGDLPDPGIEPWSPALQADSLPTELSRKLISEFIKIHKYRWKKCMTGWANCIMMLIYQTGKRFCSNPPKKVLPSLISVSCSWKPVLNWCAG